MLGSQLSVVGLGITLLAFILSITVHEFSHAFAAYSQGDLTAQQQGRLSLNPIRHLDPMGTFMLLIMAASGFGLGWGKPTPVNSANLRNGRGSMALVSVAGVISNLVLATLFGLILRSDGLPFLIAGGYLSPAASRIVIEFILRIIAVNIGLAVFNLIPLAPLDGFSVMVNILPREAGAKLAKYTHWGPGLLMLLIFLPQFIPGLHNVNVLGTIMNPPFRLLEHLIVGS